MTWEDKTEMVKFLNEGEPKKAADIVIKNKENLDEQAIDMIVTGFKNDDAKYLTPIVDIIETWRSSSLRTAVSIQALLDKIHARQFN